MSAADMANDLAHALSVSEATVADLQQQLEEANATIIAVRAVRDWAASRRRLHYDRSDADQAAAYALVLRMLDGVDGL